MGYNISVKYEKIKDDLLFWATKYANKRFKRDELFNEGWIRIQALDPVWDRLNARYTIILYIKEQSRQDRRGLPYRSAVQIDTIDDTANNIPAEEGIRFEFDTKLRLKQALKSLTKDERKIIAYKYHKGMKNKDIAVIMGCSPQWISKRLKNIRQILRNFVVLS